MAADASIYNQLLQPQPSMLDWQERYAAQDDRRQARQLNMLQLQSAQQAAKDDQDYRDAARSFGADPGANVSMLRQRGLAKQAGALEQQMLANQKTQADIGHLGAQTANQNASAAKTQFEMEQAKHQQHLQQAVAVQDVPSAIAWLNAGVSNGTLDFRKASAQVQALQNGSIDLQRWKNDTIAGGYTMQQQAMNDFNNRTLAQREADDARKDATKRWEVGVADGRVRSEGVLNRAQQGQAVTYQQGEDGSIYALPSKLAPGSAVRAVPVMAPTGVQPLTGKGAGLTEDQGKATGWLVQANNAYANMQKAIGKDAGAMKPGLPDAVSAIPSFGLMPAVGNIMRGETRQQFMQGASSLSEALLRAATGAGVNQSEAEQKMRELTPVIGDSDAVIQQKMAAIPGYLESLKVRAGPGAKKAAALAPAAPSGAPAVGTVDQGHRFKGGNPADPANWEKVQ